MSDPGHTFQSALWKCPALVLCPQLLFVGFPAQISASSCSSNSSQPQLGGKRCPQENWERSYCLLFEGPELQGAAGPGDTRPSSGILRFEAALPALQLATQEGDFTQRSRPSEPRFTFVKSGEYSTIFPNLICGIKGAWVCEKCKIILQALNSPP